MKVSLKNGTRVLNDPMLKTVWCYEHFLHQAPACDGRTDGATYS